MENYSELFRSLALTMVHSLWQGILVVVLTLLSLSVTGKANSRTRYRILFSGLMLLLSGFVVTFFLLYRHYNLAAAQVTESPFIYPESVSLDMSPVWSTGTGHYLNRIRLIVESFSPILSVAWLMGFIIMGLKMAGGLYISRTLLNKEIMMPDIHLIRIFDRVIKRLHVPVQVRLKLTARKISPMVVGFLKPVVIVPVAALSGLSPKQLEAMLMHELAHIRRYDHVMLILQAVACQVLSFHPAAWYLSNRIEQERENCCDDIVTETCDPINYIKALTMIQEMNLAGTVPANALTGRTPALLNRVRRLLKPETNHSQVSRTALLLLLFVALGIAAVTIVSAGMTGNISGINRNPAVKNDENHVMPDTTQNKALNATVHTEVSDEDKGGKKKITLVFVNDTVMEMTVNGKPVPASEIRKYEYDIQSIRNDLEASEDSMEKATRELEEAQEKLIIAQRDLERAHQNLRKQKQLSGDDELQMALNDAPLNLQEFRLLHGEEWDEHLKEIQEEAQRALEKAHERMQEFRKEDWKQLQEEWKHSREQMNKAMEEFFIQRGDSCDIFHFEPFLYNEFKVVPFRRIPPVPGVEIHPDAPLPHESLEPGELEEKLREVEEE